MTNLYSFTRGGMTISELFFSDALLWIYANLLPLTFFGAIF